MEWGGGGVVGVGLCLGFFLEQKLNTFISGGC